MNIMPDKIGEHNEVAILIPTLKRPDRILQVYENAKGSSPNITKVYFVAEREDRESIDELEKHHLSYFINERSANYAGALNTAYLKTLERYFFCGADDLDFKAGWLEKCLAKMVDPIKIVGTNDLHFRPVIIGEQATHFLVDREYIKTRSGIFDAENLVLPECYAHFSIDREVIELARLRGVFAPCLEAVVEHLHWSYGLSPKDETYARHDVDIYRDNQLYLRRRKLMFIKIRAERNLLI